MGIVSSVFKRSPIIVNNESLSVDIADIFDSTSINAVSSLQLLPKAALRSEMLRFPADADTAVNLFGSLYRFSNSTGSLVELGLLKKQKIFVANPDRPLDIFNDDYK